MLRSSPTQLYAIFHLNLAFSSVEIEAHADVVSRCYWPLLRQAESGNVPLGLEITLYTLECIQRIAPDWIEAFRSLLQAGHCELIASGDSQIIGPLVPAEVNRWNLRLGQQGYQKILGVTPRLAFINEQAVSPGLLNIYLETGFEAVVIEWDNPSSHNPDWQRNMLHRPSTLVSASGQPIKVIWNSAVAFQKFQRYAHNDITLEDYLDGLDRLVGQDCQCFPVYGSDAEVFDYRPGRYTVEAEQGHGEWERLDRLFQAISGQERYQLVLPYEALAHWREEPVLTLATADYPISVKKQAKYNITRWALSGRNDLVLNSLCFQRFQALQSSSVTTSEEWRNLCRLWASDFRTHLTQRRYDALRAELGLNVQPPVPASYTAQPGVPTNMTVNLDESRRYLRIETPGLRLVLNMKRGMSIVSLAFVEHDWEPVMGTHFHGHFDHIGFSADYYSNHLVMERFRERDRVTDLAPVDWALSQADGRMLVSAGLETAQGRLVKHYWISENEIECGFAFAGPKRPEASLRLGFITLIDCGNRPWFACHNGGDVEERIVVDKDIDHGRPVSSIVSASAGLGATTGEFKFGSGSCGLRLTWEPSECAALPMVSSLEVNRKYLNRMWFSLIEADETLKPDGILPAFRYTLQAWVQGNENV
ncbi:glycoside hydrolase [Hydrocarboniclastica marina]|uniref:Glycoside hydrolase n=1 Tax=Hydrocarboniclastica marina TaxID=2259620 RepID=A0A4P7XF30_9ALTE|nr:glycoside hydrolase [Hydrocarboniclastica marina]MAL97120.1 glycoside hydrolase [Alteromonadaceae bacterium]QCF25528.1 glycoside hydrolase [Hydrocarboniclastica marina]